MNIMEQIAHNEDLNKNDSAYLRNDYTPDFTTSLNFNFNTNDIFTN